MYVFRELFLDNDYLFSTKTDKPLILDCGSNIGLSIFYFKMLYPSCRIIAFEPDEEAFECLTANVKNNHLDKIELHNSAVSDQAGTLKFYSYESSSASLTNSTQYRADATSITVNAERLSDIINEDIQFLKMDIEGAEFKVIKDLADEGKLTRIEQLVVEYHHHMNPRIDELGKFLEMLEKNNFGYLIMSQIFRPVEAGQRQNMIIFAYRK